MLWIFDGIFELQKLWKLSHLYFLCHLQEIFQHISSCKLHWSVCIECGGCFSEKSFHHHSSSFLTRAPLSEFNSNFQFISAWNTCLLLKPFKIPFSHVYCIIKKPSRPRKSQKIWFTDPPYHLFAHPEQTNDATREYISWILERWHLSCLQIFPKKSNIEKGQKLDLCRLDIGRNSSCFKMATPNCSILPNWM